MSYESEFLRNVYLLFHYGSRDEIIDGIGFDAAAIPAEAFRFPDATVNFFETDDPGAGRALDIGCAVGRSSFALSNIAGEVIGIDFSESFVDAAEDIRSGKMVEYARYGEAHLGETLVARLPDPSRPDRIRFEQGDAMDLRAGLGSFDLVHAANLLCRLPDPDRFLERLPGLVSPGGLLVVATPCTWLDQYTPRENQPGGTTLEFLHRHLDADFELEEVAELPFLIREHVRKFQLSTSQTSRWRRK